MSIRKRDWRTTKGEQREGWIVDYVDKLEGGKRRIKTFARKRDAINFNADANKEIRAGVHVADSASITIAQAADNWLKACEQRGREQATLVQYRSHVEFHIMPLIGGMKLSKFGVAELSRFEEALFERPAPNGRKRSKALARKVRVSLSSILSNAMRRGDLARNVVREIGAQDNGVEHRAERRERGRLQVGKDIPTREEISAIIGKLDGRWRPIILTAIFTGLRASELRGLTWDAIDLSKGELHVRQRADRFNKIGPPKSRDGGRMVPLPPMVRNALAEHKKALEPNARNLVFANKHGDIEHHNNIARYGFHPAQIAAGVVDEDGRAKYSGLHSLRHWFASWCINRRVDGGLELPMKIVQARLGHSTIAMTMDVYGHLFPSGDDRDELAMAERALFAANAR
jgi:integrase